MVPWSSRFGVGLRACNPLRLNPVIVETRSRENSLYQGNTVAVPYNRRDSMMRRAGWKGQQDATEQNRPPVYPQNILKIGVAEGKRRRGRQKTLTWRRTVEKEGAEAEWQSWEEVKIVAANRDKWRHSVVALCATSHQEDS